MTKNFFMVYRRRGCRELVELVRASGVAAMVFLEMANVMDGLNKYRGTNRALGEELRLSDGAVSRAVRQLIEWGF